RSVRRCIPLTESRSQGLQNSPSKLARGPQVFSLAYYFREFFYRGTGIAETLLSVETAPMKYVLLFLALATPSISAGLERYSQFVVADSLSKPKSQDGVRITYLGTNGYQFEAGEHALLVDPYFSRIDLMHVVLGKRIEPDVARIDAGLIHIASKADAILVTHGHFDHLLDVPVVMQRTGARLIASATAITVAERAGAPASNCQA